MSDAERNDHESTRLILRPREERVRRRPQVSWTDSAGTHVLTLDQPTLVGNAPSARLMITSDPTVSRLHAELEPKGDAVWVTDLGSKNGTFVEEVQVDRARVPSGGRVRVGKTTLTIDRDPVTEVVQLWPEDRFGPLIGESSAMRELFAQLARVAPSNASVLIHGETGTGKELVARALHDASPRAAQPFVIIDCASLPEQLLESELFGHVRGAFTGAVNAREGAIEAADGGTVFLDEIGELPLSMQPKLLRVLESRTVRRVGETAARKVDVRILSATHRDLRTMVNVGAFREDLYFRLAVIPVEVPPLRDHKGDVTLLMDHFLKRPHAEVLSRETVRMLSERPWLGNVRELRNVIERILALGERDALAIDGGPPTSQRTPAGDEPRPARDGEPPLEGPFKEVREAWLDWVERAYVQQLLAKHQRNVPAASTEAGIDRTYLYRLIRKHGL